MFTRPWRTGWVLLGILTVCGEVRGDEAPRPRSIHDAAQAALSAGRTERSKVLGFDSARHSFSEVSPRSGGILVGFELGVGPDGNIEIVWALRPVYRSARGEVTGSDHGQFEDRNQVMGKKVRVIKTRVKRMVYLTAPAGYAVGGITVRSGLNINGMCVHYLRINGEALDPTQTTTSAWVGDRTGGSERSLDGKGAPVLGVIGSSDERHVFGLGLIYGPRPAPPAPAPTPKPPTPKRATQKKVLPVEPEEPQAVEPAKKGPPTTAPKPEPPKAAAAPKPPPADGVNWLPLGVFGAVVVVVGLPLYFLLRTSDSQGKPAGASPRSPAKEPDDGVLTVLPAEPQNPEGVTATLPPPPSPAWAPQREPLPGLDDPAFSRRLVEDRQERELMAKASKEVSNTLFALAGLQFVCGLAVVALAAEMVAGGPVPKAVLPFMGFVVVLVAVAFAGLGFWARFQPLPAAIVGLCLYVFLLLLDIAASPEAMRTNGLIVKVCIIAALIRCVSVASKANRSR